MAMNGSFEYEEDRENTSLHHRIDLQVADKKTSTEKTHAGNM